MNAGNKPFVLYKASAGSGKTYTLIKEFLVLCFTNNERYYKDILAVTFTNKAANEMKAKILNNLKAIINDDVKADDLLNDLEKETGIRREDIKEKTKKLYVDIIHNYSDFNISTIDSFVQQVSRSFAKELNLPSQYKVQLDEDELLDEIIQRIDKKIGKDDEMMTDILSEFIEFKLDNEENERIEAPIKDYVKKLLKENAYRKGESLYMTSLDKFQYQEVKDYLDCKIKELKKSVRDGVENIENIILKYQITEDCYDGKSRGLISVLDKIQNKKNLRDIEPSSLVTSTVRKIFIKKVWVNKKAPKDVIDRLNHDNIDVLNAYGRLIEDCNNLYFVNILRNDFYLYVLRGKLMEIVREYINETYKVHISEFNKRISDILGDCSVPFIYERIGARYKHFFIDEFQDTSVLQWFNFLPLISNSLSFGNKNLLVGDAKQAIYRFRSGEVEQIIKLPKIHQNPDNMFSNDCEKLLGLNWNPKLLDTNYRTKENIVRFNNEFFDYSKEMLNNDLYRSVYADNMKQKFKDNDYKGFVRVEIFKMDSFKEEGKHRANSAKYKEAVKESLLNQIAQLKEMGYDYKDITILVRRSADGSDIAEYLTKSEMKIPVVSSDSISLKSSDKVTLMILTLRHLLDENNDVIRLSMKYYREICGNSDDDSINMSAVVKNIKEQVSDDMKNNNMSIYDTCVKIAKSYGFNVIDDVFLQYFMSVVNDWQNAETGGLTEFLEYWDRKSDALYVKIPSDIDAVQIMTVHKSKGLEFKIVMYPYAFTQLPDDFKGEERWLSCKNDFKAIGDIPHIDSFILPVNKSKLENTIFERYYLEEKEKAAFDDFNIMYVAMTRPKDMLFVYANDAKSKDNKNLFLDYIEYAKEKYSMKSGNLDEDISYVYEMGETCTNRKDDKKKALNVLELDDNYDGSTINWMETVKVDEDPVMIRTAEKKYQPQEWGVLVHEILSKIKTKDDARRVMLPYIYNGSIDNVQAESLLEQFEEIASSEKIKEAYSDACIVKSEMEMLTADGKILRPDRYSELPDKVILVDYKTGRKDTEHHKQLKSYMTSLENMHIGKEIEAYLVYLREDEIEIDPV